jgi:catecholate siderophore receptor
MTQRFRPQRFTPAAFHLHRARPAALAARWACLLALASVQAHAAEPQPVRVASARDAGQPTQGEAEAVLPEVKVQAQPERADGPVQGYRATRSASFSKTDTPVRELPASVSVVGTPQMRDQAMRSLADVLRQVPGVSVHQGEGNRDQMVLRGNVTLADFYIDGVRDDGIVFRDLYNLERVEVLRGPAGMVFGRGGAGGVLNRVSKRPEPEALAEAALSVDGHGGARLTADVGNALQAPMAWRVNAVVDESRSFRDGVNGQRQAVNPSLQWAIAPGSTLLLGTEFFHDERTADRGQPSQNGRPVDAPASRFFGNAEQSLSKADVAGAYALLETTAGAWQVKNQLRATSYDKFYQNVYADNAASSSVAANGTLKLAAYNNANERLNVFNQLDLSRELEWAGLRHELLAGMELGSQDSRSQRQTGYFGNDKLVTVSVNNPVATATRFEASPTDTHNRVRADVAALYVQDQLWLNPQWKLVAGLRHDLFKVSLDDLRTDPSAKDLARTDRLWSHRLGLVWLPSDQNSVYLSYNDAALPSGETLSLAANTADLAPETSVNWELGARWELRPSLSLSAAVFRLDRLDVKSPDPLNPGYYVQTGQHRTEGLELAAQGEVRPGWLLSASYARLNGRIMKTTSAATAGSKLALVPEHQGSVWNRVALSPRWAVGAGLVGQGASYAALDNAVRLPGFVRADGAVYFDAGRWGMAQSLQLALNVENLGNQHYWATAHANNNLSPGAPRQWTLTLRAGF